MSLKATQKGLSLLMTSYKVIIFDKCLLQSDKVIVQLLSKASRFGLQHTLEYIYGNPRDFIGDKV